MPILIACGPDPRDEEAREAWAAPRVFNASQAADKNAYILPLSKRDCLTKTQVAWCADNISGFRDLLP
jgi:hypothetical protein